MAEDPPPVLTDNPYFNTICLILYDYFTFFKTSIDKEFKQYEIWQVITV